MGHFERKILGRWERRLQSTLWNFAAVFCRQKLKFTGKIEKSRFVPPFGAVRGNVHGSSMARWKARGQLPMNANWTFSLALMVKALWANIGLNCAVRKGLGHYECKFQEEGGSSTSEFWRQKTGFPWLSRGVVCVILHLGVWYNTGVWHTDTRTRDHGYYPCRGSSVRVNICTQSDPPLQKSRFWEISLNAASVWKLAKKFNYG